MRFYFVQHGEAAAKDVDPRRPLTDRGRRGVERMGAWLAATGLSPAAVLHSGKLRAEQTAEVLARCLGAPGARATRGMDPDDGVEAFAVHLDSFDDGTMFVGHLPFMARLVSLLLGAPAESGRVQFRTGSVVCLSREKEGAWALEWMLRPDLLPGPPP